MTEFFAGEVGHCGREERPVTGAVYHPRKADPIYRVDIEERCGGVQDEEPNSTEPCGTPYLRCDY